METLALRKDKVLVVEDNFMNAAVIISHLEYRKCFEIYHASDGLSGWQLFKEEQFDICLLDISMPGIDGFALARLIREVNQQVPIIFLTARGFIEDRLEGLSIGGDDYILKPFHAEELVLKMNNFLHRSRASRMYNKTIYEIRGYTLDMEQLTLSRGEISEELPVKEARVLLLLVKHINTIISRAQILKDVWGEDNYYTGRSLDVYISKLRKRFSADRHILIEARRNIGYRLQIIRGIV